MNEQFLNLENEDNVYTDALFKRLLLQSGSNGTGDPSSHVKTSDGVPYIVIKLKPGFCMKTRTDTGEKVFINICQSGDVPEPKDISDDELLKVLESEDPTHFRIPMSIGEPHVELDKSGGGCTAYDVVVHSNVLKKLDASQLFKTFFLTIMCEGIEVKHNILLKRDWIFLKNRKCVGKLAAQNVRTKSKPLIMDMDRAPEPKFTIIQEPHEGHPEFLVAEIHLPNIKTAQSLTLEIGEDRLLLTTRSHVYHLDIFLPFQLVSEECGAQFDRVSKVLTATMPVKAAS
ncbi:hypothetical protein BsWGS_28389 [Bradybaena similaris]